MRYVCVMLLMSAAVSWAASGKTNSMGGAQWEKEGQSFFLSCEFKKAAHAFEKALMEQPDKAAVHYWLGKSYARLAEISSPLSAPRNARRARRSLEQAVAMDPAKQEYLEELFEFCLDSPEWLHDGSDEAAALLERISALDPTTEPMLRAQLVRSIQEHSGAGWRMRQAVLWTSGTVGYLIPQPQP